MISIPKTASEKQAFAARGDAWYESTIKPGLKPEDEGKFVAVDVETGEYGIAEDELEAIDLLHARRPGALVRLRRVGSSWTHKFGAGRR